MCAFALTALYKPALILMFLLFQLCIFLFCCQSAPDVSFLFVKLQYFFHKRVKLGLNFRKTLADIFMNS